MVVFSVFKPLIDLKDNHLREQIFLAPIGPEKNSLVFIALNICSTNFILVFTTALAA